MQQATHFRLSPSRQSSYQPQPIPNLQDKVGTLCSQPQCEPPASRETLLQQLDKDKIMPSHVPRLRAVVESQAFKNILVDEMDMMLSRAATLIQANWRGYRLRQKLISQMLAAKAIQEAWRRFSTRRLLRSGKAVEKKVSIDEGDIPYHHPQQVRFQHLEEGRYLPAPPIMVSKETQFPSADHLAVCAHELDLLQPPGTPQPGMQAPSALEASSVIFLPHQNVSMRLPCPVSLNAKCHPCLMTRTVRSSSLVHIDGDMMKTKQVTARTNKAGSPGPPPSRSYAQTLYGPLKTQTQTQAPVEAEVLKAPPQAGPAPVMTKTPTPLHSCLASMMNKSSPQPCPVPTVTIAKTPPQVYPAAPVAKTPLQSCLAAILNKIPTQPCPVPTIMMTKSQPQPYPAAPMTKIPVQVRPTASMTSTASQTRPTTVVAKIPPQICLLTSIIRPPTQTCPVPVMAKTPPQTCPMRPVATMAKTPLQTCPTATITKTPSQTLPGSSMTKAPPQTRLAAMITKTPAQLRSVAAILKTLCLSPPAAGNLKASPPAAMAAGIPSTLSHTCLNRPKTKAGVTAKQTTGVVKVSSHSHLTEGKVKYCSPRHLGAGTPKAPARPLLEAEKVKGFSQKQVKTETVSNTGTAMEVPRTLPWAKVAEDKSKGSSQAHLRMGVVKVQSQGYMPVEAAVVPPQAQVATYPAKTLPQAQLATRSTTTSPQGHLLTELTTALPQARLSTCLSKASSQTHPPAKLTKTPSLDHLGTCLTKTQSQAHLATGAIKVQSQAYLPTGLTKAQSQAHLVTETAKCLYAAHQAAELSSKTQSQPLLAGYKASTQPCQHIGSIGTFSRAKPEDRLTQLPATSHVQGRATQGPRQGASETQSMLVPLLASAGHPTCNVESWGDSGATRTQPSTTSPAAPCQEELATSQLTSLCAELAALLGSQEDLRTQLAKALSQGEVRAALNQALSKEVLGATMAKARPQGMLGTALVKALSWGELGAALSRVLSRGELRAELTKAMQGKLVDILSKALTEEERAALSQALCQGELGAVLSQSLSQAALRTGLVLPKVAAAKTAGSGMRMTPAPVEVDYRGSPSAAWGPTLGPARPQPSKGPVDAGVAGGKAWNSAVPSVAVGPMNSAVAPGSAWEPPTCAVPWDAVGSKAAVDPRQSGKLVASMRVVEKIIVQAVVTIQACARGYLVRRTIKVWHQWAIIIQAAWRGHCVRRDLAQLCRASTIIQAMWRGYRVRRSRTQQMLPPGTWAKGGGRAKSSSDHRCFQSCQPHVCTLCQSLSAGLGSPPSVVMLVGSSPRTCHMCGHTLPTRVVQGLGRGIMGQADIPWGYDNQLTHQSPQQLHGLNKAATVIQAAWRGFVVRRRLRQQQLAAKMLQANWRGHYTRNSLTTDALLGPAEWDIPQNMQWPGV
ncbi:IQ domain-containing protein N [Pteropus vampyrus]|uniref:IQ domain-containing protein N n=1 Tax=Pteropus vampyrus TaxID=132908 RepID=A0A6P6CS77_PTEVA|nr:IQ domain-containing protein N [Pteropus vampyrus]